MLKPIPLEEISGALGGAIVTESGPALMDASDAIDVMAELSAAAKPQ